VTVSIQRIVEEDKPIAHSLLNDGFDRTLKRAGGEAGGSGVIQVGDS
jgi:hypothetical protein